MKHETTIQKSPKTYRLDYTPWGFDISHIDLEFKLHPTQTVVTASYKVTKRQDIEQVFNLKGENIKLLSITLNEQALEAHQYELTNEQLIIPSTPQAFSLKIATQINPKENTELEGLYLSNDMYCTQCEAEGFRRIIFHPDRPDVLSTYTTTIYADKATYPYLLSNGNRQASGEADDNKHWVKWHDPHPKPSYLFALVAGDLCKVTDSYTTMSKKEVAIEFYVEEGNEDKCGHAINALKKAMHWDEQEYQREYDLNTYMVVAVEDFNMGAMENKGLNIFNAKYVLANPETATDDDFKGVEAVIAHEYFHNWTGNRVTCRDWFQLSLKEGLTVFREQSFCESVGSAAEQRINDVNYLRTFQFTEDSGPMAHSVRPDEYVTIDNFYTPTIYNKGAEVIRMLKNLIGEQAFKQGMRDYFNQYDGQAVTCDDFVACMAKASGQDLSQFMRWYSQAGTPALKVTEQYDDTQKQYTLIIEQNLPETPNQSNKKPQLIPLKYTLLSQKGETISPQKTLIVTEKIQKFPHEQISIRPVLSLLESFSAPVKVECTLGSTKLKSLIMHAADPFSRWESAQQLMVNTIQDPTNQTLYTDLKEVFTHILEDNQTDPMLQARLLSLPNEKYLFGQTSPINPSTTHTNRYNLFKALAKDLENLWCNRIEQIETPSVYEFSAQQIANRTLKNLCLYYLVHANKEHRAKAESAYKQANNMTDKIGALRSLTDENLEQTDGLLDDFYQTYQKHPLVLDKWLTIQALAYHQNTLQRVIGLTEHPSFKITNPNKVRALIGAFTQNTYAYHLTSGQGYRFMAQKIAELDALNPQIAARLLDSFARWKQFDTPYKEQLHEQLLSLKSNSTLSKNVSEIIMASL